MSHADEIKNKILYIKEELGMKATIVAEFMNIEPGTFYKNCDKNSTRHSFNKKNLSNFINSIEERLKKVKKKLVR